MFILSARRQASRASTTAELGVVTVSNTAMSIALWIMSGSPVTTEEAHSETTPRKTALLATGSLV